MSQTTFIDNVETPKKVNSIADVVKLLNTIGNALFKGHANIFGVSHDMVFDAAYYLTSRAEPLHDELRETEKTMWSLESEAERIEKAIDSLASLVGVKIEEDASYATAVDCIEARVVELREAGVTAIDAAYVYDEDPQAPEWRSLMQRIRALEALCR